MTLTLDLFAIEDAPALAPVAPPPTPEALAQLDPLDCPAALVWKAALTIQRPGLLAEWIRQHGQGAPAHTVAARLVNAIVRAVASDRPAPSPDDCRAAAAYLPLWMHHHAEGKPWSPIEIEVRA